MSIFLIAYRNRTRTFQVSVKNAAGSEVDFDNDVMRIKIGRDDQTPILDLDSVSGSTNGSTVSGANPTTVRLDKADLDIFPQILNFEVGVVDDVDNNTFKHAEKGVIAILPTQRGDVGAT